MLKFLTSRGSGSILSQLPATLSCPEVTEGEGGEVRWGLSKELEYIEVVRDLGIESETRTGYGYKSQGSNRTIIIYSSVYV